MEHEDYLKAAVYWTDHDSAEPADQHMDDEALRSAVEAFLAGHDTLALATCANGLPRCTPLEYGWHDGALWVFSEGGRKFLGLEPVAPALDAPVSCAVFESYAGFGKLESAQVTGRASIVNPASPAFAAAAAAKGIPASRLPMLAERLHLIKIVPTEVDLLDSSLKEQGFSSRQHLKLAGPDSARHGLGDEEAGADELGRAPKGAR